MLKRAVALGFQPKVERKLDRHKFRGHADLWICGSEIENTPLRRIVDSVFDNKVERASREIKRGFKSE